MTSRCVRLVLAVLAMALTASPAAAQEQPTDSARIAELERQVAAITEQLEELLLGREVVAQADTAMFGLGPGASKVYRVRQGVSIAGYGEMLYERFASEREDGTPSGIRDQLDYLRAILYVGYKFNDRFLFNSELEFEHGSTDQAGSVSVEFAYLDYLLSPAFGVRAGMLLPPMGFINELHEPVVFLGTERPETESRIIPSTWRENGIGVFGGVAGLSYRAYLINGFDGVGGGSSKAGGFSASGLRGGRQKGSKAVAEDFAAVARVDYEAVLGLTVGGSAYVGKAGQGNSSPSAPGQTIGARTVIAEGHVQFRAYGFDVRGLAAVATVDDVAELNAAKGLAGSGSIGERLVGWYVDAGYDILHGVDTSHRLTPYLRYEQIDTQDKVPAGFTADPANDQDIVTIGISWRPITNIAVKADYQIRRNAADTAVDQVNVNIGYLF